MKIHTRKCRQLAANYPTTNKGIQQQQQKCKKCDKKKRKVIKCFKRRINIAEKVHKIFICVFVRPCACCRNLNAINKWENKEKINKKL